MIRTSKGGPCIETTNLLAAVVVLFPIHNLILNLADLLFVFLVAYQEDLFLTRIRILNWNFVCKLCVITHTTLCPNDFLLEEVMKSDECRTVVDDEVELGA